LQIHAGSSRLLLGTMRAPPLHDCRVLSEDNYQRAVACVNACAGIDDPKAALVALAKAARECGEELRLIAERHGESIVDFASVHALDGALRNARLAPTATQ
jgi:hypothetical protein